MPTDPKWEFFGAWAETYEIHAYNRCVVRFRDTYHEWVFVMHVPLVNFMSKLTNVCLMKTQLSDVSGTALGVPLNNGEILT
jgi:hypothetical protein